MRKGNFARKQNNFMSKSRKNELELIKIDHVSKKAGVLSVLTTIPPQICSKYPILRVSLRLRNGWKSLKHFGRKYTLRCEEILVEL